MNLGPPSGANQPICAEVSWSPDGNKPAAPGRRRVCLVCSSGMYVHVQYCLYRCTVTILFESVTSGGFFFKQTSTAADKNRESVTM